MKSLRLTFYLLFPCVFYFADAQQRPNIIFILCDDLGYDDLGCYGNPYVETPFINKLAESGIRFTQAYAASPVCSPSRAAILTGKHPARLRLTNFQGGYRTDSFSLFNPAVFIPDLHPAEITLAERMKRLGYSTGMIGKWHLGNSDEVRPWAQGFDETRVIGRGGLDYYNYTIFENSHQKQFIDSGTNYLTDKLTSYAINFIEQKRNSPFFLYLCYTTPHVFLVPRSDKLKKYYSKYEKFGGRYNPVYAAMIESLDDGVGKISQTLSDLDLLKNTVIVFTSDNGAVGIAELGPVPSSVSSFRKWKGHVYEGGIRVPAIISWKNHFPANTICELPFSNLDYTPTIMQLLEEPYEGITTDSKSIYRFLLDPLLPIPSDTIFWHYPHFSNQLGRPGAAIRAGDFKLIEWYENGKTELYNLNDDPGEKKDLAKKNPQTAKKLLEHLHTWQKQVDANMLIKKKN